MSTKSSITRRKFLGSASILALSSSLVSFKTLESVIPAKISQQKRLWDDLSDEEKKMAGNSKRATYAVQIDEGSCAEKVLQTTLKSFGKPEKHVSFAASFGGGIRKGDLCGMLTGGFMSIGFAADRLIKDEELRPAWVKEKTDEFWTWWEELAPRHCNELRPLYANDDRAIHSTNFNNMLQRVTLKLDEMFEMEGHRA